MTNREKRSLVSEMIYEYAKDKNMLKVSNRISYKDANTTFHFEDTRTVGKIKSIPIRWEEMKNCYEVVKNIITEVEMWLDAPERE